MVATPPIKNASQIYAPWTHWFLYGDTGSGKTSCASTFPRPIFIVPTDENSIVTLKGMNIDYIEIYGAKGHPRTGGWGLENAIAWLEQQLNKDPEGFPYDTVVIEALSHYLDQVQEELSEGNTKQMDQQKWGKLSGHLRNIHSRLRNMDVHVVFTALVKEEKDAANNATALPLMSGRMGYMLPSACDVIGYCKERPGKPESLYDVHFRKYMHFPARSRFRGMPQKVTNFRFDDMLPYVNGVAVAPVVEEPQAAQ